MHNSNITDRGVAYLNYAVVEIIVGVIVLTAMRSARATILKVMCKIKLCVNKVKYPCGSFPNSVLNASGSRLTSLSACLLILNLLKGS